MAAPYITLAAMMTAVRDNLDEATASFWTEARLRRSCIRAIDTVWAEVRKLGDHGYFEVTRKSTDGSVTIRGDSYATSGFALTTSAITYTLPPDFIEMVTMYVITSGYTDHRFSYLDKAHPVFQALRGSAATGQGPTLPPYYTLRGERTLLFSSYPSVAVDLEITYVKAMPLLLADGTDDSDDVELPYPLHIAAEEVATWRCQLQDRGDPTAQQWAAVASASVSRYLAGHRRQNDPVYVWSPLE